MKSGFGEKVLGEKVVAKVFEGDHDAIDSILTIERTDKEEVMIQFSHTLNVTAYIQLDEFLKAAKRVKEADL